MFQQQPTTTTTGSFMQGGTNPNQSLQMTFGGPSATTFQNPMMQQGQNPQGGMFPGQQTNPMGQQTNFMNPMQQQQQQPQMNPYNPQLGNTSLKTLTNNQNQENELQIVFNNFLNAINIQNKECLFKSPVYNEIPPNVHPNHYSTYTYIPDMDLNTWEQYFRANPNPTKFYVDQIRGIEELAKRYSNRIEGFQFFSQQMQINQKKIDDLKNQGSSQIKERIKEIKAKNGILMDKILSVHNLIEKISIKYNQFERNTNDEAFIIKKIGEVENYTTESTTKINDIKLNFIERINNDPASEKYNPTSQKKNFSQAEIEEQKRKTLHLLEQMKQGIEILQNVSQRDIKEFNIFQNFIETNKY